MDELCHDLPKTDEDNVNFVRQSNRDVPASVRLTAINHHLHLRSTGPWTLKCGSLKFGRVLNVRHLRNGHTLFDTDSVMQLGAVCSHDAP